MKKRMFVSSTVLLLFAFLLPFQANACGGFIAVKGEHTFHSVYCDEMEGEELKNIRWYNTAKEAEKSGMKMCTKCETYHDLDFDPEYCEMYFSSSDPLLITAMEQSIELGVEAGQELGYECAYDDLSGQYDAGYDKGYSDAKDWLEHEYQQKEEAISESNRLDNVQLLCVVISLLICFIVFIDFLSTALASIKKKEPKSGFSKLIDDFCSDNLLLSLALGAAFAYGIISMLIH